MGELRLLTGITSLAMLLSFGLWVGMVVYVVARWRAYREGASADPQLGLKTAVAMFLTLAFQALLVGGFVLAWAVFTDQGSDGRSDLMRQAFALLVPAGLVFAAHFVLLQRTNALSLPLVPRMFAGVSLIVTGLIGFIALLMLFQVLFKRGDAGEEGRTALAAALVYTSAWVVQGLRFVKRVAQGSPPADVQQYARPVPPPLVPPPS